MPPAPPLPPNHFPSGNLYRKVTTINCTSLTRSPNTFYQFCAQWFDTEKEACDGLSVAWKDSTCIMISSSFFPFSYFFLSFFFLCKFLVRWMPVCLKNMMSLICVHMHSCPLHTHTVTHTHTHPHTHMQIYLYTYTHTHKYIYIKSERWFRSRNHYLCHNNYHAEMQ